tara:strand:- start:1851 stop:2624 length:774 start_codon:yes stop_codon:yes gene_type:complete
MKILRQLLQHNFLNVGETLYFEFKKFIFYCKISEDGILHDCSYKNIETSMMQKCHEAVAGFQSLTDWSDLCVQEISGEYVTRFSAWKRVRRMRTKRLVGELRDIYRSKIVPTSNRSPCKSCVTHKRGNLLLVQQNKILCEILKRWEDVFIKKKSKNAIILRDCERLTDILNAKSYKDTILITSFTRNGKTEALPGKKRRIKSSTAPPKKKKKKEIVIKMNANDILCKNGDMLEKMIIDKDISDEQFNELLISFFKLN